jgi:hydroxypyruvate isomerase
MKFDINCSILLTGLPLLGRPGAARALGFDAVEFWWPFPEAVPADREVDAFVAALADAGVRLAALNFAAGDLAAGERGMLSHPDRAAEFRDSVDVAAGIAARTGCPVFNALYGNRPGDPDLAQENLVRAARAVPDATVVIEPLNSHDCPLYPVTSAQRARDLIESVAEPNLGLLADVYHLARMGEDIPAALADPRLAHVQFADVPGRGAPGTGTLDFEILLRQLAAQDYRGQIGYEFVHNDAPLTPATFLWR